MHKFLRAIGFSQFDTKKKVYSLLQLCSIEPDTRMYTTNGEDTLLTEYCKDFAPNMGIALCGELDEGNQFYYDHYYPYFRGSHISSQEDISIERQASGSSYAGVCDDIRMGVSLIFYLQNVIEYVKIKNENRLPIRGTTLTLSGLSFSGTIMMPINKNEHQIEKIRKESISRNHLLQAARKGDERAIETLTLEDMDIYSSISRKIHKEDIFSLVDTYFMPYGVECDHYSVLGEITECSKVKNRLSGEEIYTMSLSCNELNIDICINAQDIYGEPQVGRRFKGLIWLQGFVNFPA